MVFLECLAFDIRTIRTYPCELGYLKRNVKQGKIRRIERWVESVDGIARSLVAMGKLEVGQTGRLMRAFLKSPIFFTPGAGEEQKPAWHSPVFEKLRCGFLRELHQLFSGVTTPRVVAFARYSFETSRAAFGCLLYANLVIHRSSAYFYPDSTPPAPLPSDTGIPRNSNPNACRRAGRRRGRAACRQRCPWSGLKLHSSERRRVSAFLY